MVLPDTARIYVSVNQSVIHVQTVENDPPPQQHFNWTWYCYTGRGTKYLDTMAIREVTNSPALDLKR